MMATDNDATAPGRPASQWGFPEIMLFCFRIIKNGSIIEYEINVSRIQWNFTQSYPRIGVDTGGSMRFTSLMTLIIKVSVNGIVAVVINFGSFRIPDC